MKNFSEGSSGAIPGIWVKLSPMQLGYRKMGCGRSKHEQSNKNSQEDLNDSYKTGKKKKLKGEYIMPMQYQMVKSNGMYRSTSL